MCNSGIQRARIRLENNIKMDLRNRMGSMDWLYLTQDREALVNMIIKLPYNFGKFLSSRAALGFSKRTWLHGFS
jgi:hypothetical protein